MMTFAMFEREFRRELRRYAIEDFKVREFATEAGGIPPKILWDNAMPTIVRLQILRTYLDRAIIVCTPVLGRRGYRDARANNAVGGVSGSIHMRWNAFDLTVPGLSTDETVEAMERKFSDTDQALWGLGRYSTFVHWDTRGLLGEPAPARWDTRALPPAA